MEYMQSTKCYLHWPQLPGAAPVWPAGCIYCAPSRILFKIMFLKGILLAVSLKSFQVRWQFHLCKFTLSLRVQRYTPKISAPTCALQQHFNSQRWVTSWTCTNSGMAKQMTAHPCYIAQFSLVKEGSRSSCCHRKMAMAYCQAEKSRV